MAERTPQLVIELFAGTEQEPPRITIRSSADAPTTIVPASVESASEAASRAPGKRKAAKKKASRKKRGARKQEPEQELATAVAAAPAPKDGRRKKKVAKKKVARKKKAKGGRGRQPYPDRQTLQAKDGEATAELFRQGKKWHLQVDGTDVGDGRGWISRKQALQAATEVLGEYEVVSDS